MAGLSIADLSWRMAPEAKEATEPHFHFWSPVMRRLIIGEGCHRS